MTGPEEVFVCPECSYPCAVGGARCPECGFEYDRDTVVWRGHLRALARLGPFFGMCLLAMVPIANDIPLVIGEILRREKITRPGSFFFLLIFASEFLLLSWGVFIALRRGNYVALTAAGIKSRIGLRRQILFRWEEITGVSRGFIGPSVRRRRKFRYPLPGVFTFESEKEFIREVSSRLLNFAAQDRPIVSQTGG